jgi:hypothetical protein
LFRRVHAKFRLAVGTHTVAPPSFGMHSYVHPRGCVSQFSCATYSHMCSPGSKVLPFLGRGFMANTHRSGPECRRSPFFASSPWHAALLSLRRHRGSRHGHAAAVPVHRHGPDASMRTHVPVPTRATTRAPAWRGQGQAFGSLSRLTSSAPHPSTGRGFATDGNPSSLEARAPT